MRRKIRIAARLLLLSILGMAWFAPSADAQTNITTTGPNDYWFSFNEPVLFQARAYAQEYGIDSMLWFYDQAGNLLTANDDWFGLDSWIEYQVQPGSYRLRTGVCCGNPDAWYGTSYVVSVNADPVPPETTTTTTVVEETTTTFVEETTTTVEETTTTVEETTTTTEAPPPPTDSVPEETTTTVEETTTTTIVEEQTTTNPPRPPKPTNPPEETWPPTTESTTPTTMPITTAPVTTAPATSAPPSTEILTPSSAPSTEPAVTNAVTQPPATAPTATGNVDPVDNQPSNATTTSTTTTTVFTTETAPPQDAPDEVREEFEQSVDLFSGAYDDYVPLDSKITVAQRRVVIAVTAVLFVIPTPSTRRKGK